MTQQIIATQMWRYVSGVLKCPGRPDRPVGPINVDPPGGGTPTDPFVLGVTEPDATNTGTASVTSWATTGPDITSPLVITVPNTVIEYRNIKATIDVQAANVTIRYCNITGPTGTAANRPLIYCLAAGASVNIDRCTFRPTLPNHNITAAYGHDMHVTRCNISGCVDGFGSQAASGSTVANNAFEGNYAWGWSLFSPDSNHATDNRSHNDFIQTFSGTGVSARGNSVHGYGDPAASSDTLGYFPAPYYTNALFEINAITQGGVDDLHILENWLYGAISTINAADPKVTATAEIRGNRIKALPRGGRGGICVTKTAANLTITASANTLPDGSPVTFTYGDGRTNI